MQVSEPVEGTLRDISESGLALETRTIFMDGLHISYDRHPARKNRVYLQWDLPGKRSIKAVAETIWYERLSGSEESFVVGLRFVEMTAEDRSSIREFLGTSRDKLPL